MLDAADILDDLNSLLPVSILPAEAPRNQSPGELSETEQVLWQALADGETQMDTIIARTGLPAATASSQLMRMELKRLVKQLPGRCFVRLE